MTAAAGVASGVKSGRYIDRVNRLLALLPFCAAVAAGCGESAAPAAADGAAVRASSDAITAQEADAALARSPHATRELAERARREAIDRAPRVLQAMEAAKSEILARAYLQQVAQAQPRPSAEEVRNYYKQHPELFAQRRLFTLEEIEVAREAGVAARLQERVAKAASLDEIADWLRLREVQHAVTRGVRAAEQIPLELLPRLQAMKDGELALVDPGGDALFVIRVVAAREAPLDEAAAAPLIEQYLLRRKWSEAIGTEMQRLSLGARIGYVQERK